VSEPRSREQARIREHPRVDCDDMEARIRVEGGQWRRCLVGDLSAGGARLMGAEGVEPGTQLEIVLEPEGHEGLRLAARVMRVQDGVAGVRFIALSDDQWHLLEHELKPRLSRIAPEPVSVAGEQRDVSSADLQCGVLYERLGLAADCSDTELRETAELILTCIQTALDGTAGARRERLVAASVALERMRPLWTDPAARAAYDKRSHAAEPQG